MLILAIIALVISLTIENDVEKLCKQRCVAKDLDFYEYSTNWKGDELTGCSCKKPDPNIVYLIRDVGE